jgi:hypothetical protein
LGCSTGLLAGCGVCGSSFTCGAGQASSRDIVLLVRARRRVDVSGKRAIRHKSNRYARLTFSKMIDDHVFAPHTAGVDSKVSDIVAMIEAWELPN